MANKRMFSLSVVDTDSFLEMHLSSRLLYYELGMRADDDGFVDNWKKILAFTGLKDDDLKVLIAKKYIIPFDSGVIVIRHWRMNNYLQNDRTKPTIYQDELEQLDTDNNNVYNLYTNCIHSIDKNSIEKNRLDIRKENIKEKNFKKPTLQEVKEYCDERSNGVDPRKFIDFYESKGWVVGRSPMKDWKACVRTWEKSKKETSVPEWFNQTNETTECTEEEFDSLLGI